MVMLMSKKQPKMDRLAMRFVPIEEGTLRERAEQMAKWAGIMLAAADEMRDLSLPPLDYDGHGAFIAACDLFEKVARKARGHVEENKL